MWKRPFFGMEAYVCIGVFWVFLGFFGGGVGGGGVGSYSKAPRTVELPQP